MFVVITPGLMGVPTFRAASDAEKRKRTGSKWEQLWKLTGNSVVLNLV